MKRSDLPLSSSFCMLGKGDLRSRSIWVCKYMIASSCLLFRFDRHALESGAAGRTETSV